MMAIPTLYATILGAILALSVCGRAATNQTFQRDGLVEDDDDDDDEVICSMMFYFDISR
jgi:hypothetical protein